MANLPQITNYTQLQAAVLEWVNRIGDPTLVPRVPDLILLAEKDIRSRQEWFLEKYSIANGANPLPITTHPMQLPDYVRKVKGMWAASASYRHPITLVTQRDIHDRMSSSITGAWNQLMPGIPTIAVIDAQMATWMQDGQTGIGPWITFWPSPVGAPVPGAGGALAHAVITGGVVTSVVVDAGGSGYDVNNPPSVMFFGGGPGVGAAANVTIVGGVVTAITVTAGGSGYTSAPNVALAGFAIDFKYVRDLPSIITAPSGANTLLLAHPDIYLYGSLLQTAPWLQQDDRLQTWSSLYEAGLKAANKEAERAETSDVPKRMALPRSF